MSSFLEIDNAALLRAQDSLRVFMEPNMTKVMRGTAAAGARVLVPALRVAAPVKGRGGTSGSLLSRGGARTNYGAPGDLRRSIRIAYSRKSHARGGEAYVAGPMGKRAFTRWWVTEGTKPHIIQGKVGHKLRLPFSARSLVHHPGARANPFVARVGRQQHAAVRAAMLKYIAKQVKKAGRL